MSIVQVRLLGGIGNQLHMYAAVRKYAQLHGATFECPDWFGRKVFGLGDAYLSCDLPQVDDKYPMPAEGGVNCSIGGYFQSQRWVGLLSRAELKQWFKIQPRFLELCPPRPSPWYTACHLRRGDYVGHQLYCTVTKESYTTAMKQFGLPLGPLVWVSDEHPQRVPALDAEGLDWLPDFVILMRANVILRGPSTFSWWAATLSDAQVYSPVVEDQTGERTVKFEQGNWPRCAGVGLGVEDLHLKD